jgi:hypothetical protein
MEKPLKRISLMIRSEQYDRLVKEGINLSGLVRDLLDDHFSEHCITVTVNAETQKLYSRIVANTGTSDVEVEPYLRSALQALLKDKIQDLVKLEQVAFVKHEKKTG